MTVTNAPASSVTSNSGYMGAALPDGNHTGDSFINDGAKICTAQVDRASSTTLTDITGLSVNVLAGASYIFRSHLSGTSTTNGGAKFAIGGTATATSITYTAQHKNAATTNAVSTTTTKGNAVGASTTVLTDAYIEGAIVVANAGTLTVQVAQNASHADTTSIYINSDFIVTRVA